MNGANSRGLLSVNSCEVAELGMRCASGPPLGIWWPERLDAGITVWGYNIEESSGA